MGYYFERAIAGIMTGTGIWLVAPDTKTLLGMLLIWLAALVLFSPKEPNNG